jgi:hypothetical protein
VVTNFHRAMRSLRARATIITLRSLGLPFWARLWNHLLSVRPKTY